MLKFILMKTLGTGAYLNASPIVKLWQFIGGLKAPPTETIKVAVWA